MNVLSRPLFRQAGGPAQPMAQDMGQEIQRVATQLDYLNTMASVEPNLAKKEQAILAIQNLAQATPPEIFQAAQKLVSDARAARSPDVMANPNMDPGNRSFVSPVNRANGGEMMAPPMPPPMAAEQMMAASPPPPPPEVEMLAQAEAGATAQGQELGAAYAQQMMAGIDGAQSTEDLINALRGNDKSLEARRDELAGYVGQDDANQTPESVLAMVQPVIMMTEEGMMDSGIGALVQQIAGDVEMTTADGTPTDMGMGVGSLMAAGAQEAPAPQNFRQGGEVVLLQTGSSATSTAGGFSPLTFDFGSEVKTQYETLMPLFQSIVSSEDRAAQAQEREEMDRAQAMLALARGGLRLAAGDPESGGSLASQIGSAFEPTAAEIADLGAQAQDRKDAIQAQDQQLRLGALQAGVGQAGAEQKYAQELDLATQEAALRMGTAKPDLRVVTENATGKTVYIDVAKPTGKAQLDEINVANAASPEGNVYSVNTLSSENTGGAKVFMVNGQQRLSFRPGFYKDSNGDQKPLPTDAIPLGEENAWDIIQTEARRQQAAKTIQDRFGSGDQALGATVSGGTRDENGNPIKAALTEEEGQALQTVLKNTVIPEARNPIEAAREGTGPWAGLTALLDNVYGGVTGTDAFQNTMANRQFLRGITVLGRSALVVNPRFPVAEMENVQALFPDPDRFWVNPQSQANQLIEMKRLASSQLLKNLQMIAPGGGASSEMIPDIEANNREIERLLDILVTVPMTYGTTEAQSSVVGNIQNALGRGRNG